MNESHQPDDLVGQRLGGYRLTALLGRGGTSSVYRAEDVVLGRQVAVKVLPGWMVGSDRHRLDQFLQEARAAAQLQHPNVVTIYHVGQQGDHYFVAMEYMGGGSLKDLLERGERLSPSLAVAVIRQAARGLAAAHRSGIIHRDIKPSNLLMTEEGVVKVADFGLAGRIEVESESGPTTLVEGTPRFISPELCLGHPPSLASDVYALGMTWYALLAGAPAFGGKTSQDIFRKHLRAPVPDITRIRPDVPPAHGMLIAQSLAKLPEDRFDSAAHLLDAIEAVVVPSAGPAAAEAAVVEAASLRDLVLASRAAAADLRRTTDDEARAAAATRPTASPSLMVPLTVLFVFAALVATAIIVFLRVFQRP